MYIAVFSFLLVVSVFVIIILVTELNKKKEALITLRSEKDAGQREVRLLKEALDKLDLLYLAHDMEGTIISANKKTEQFLHISPQDIGHRKLADFFLPEGQSGWENHIKSILQKEESHGRFQFRLENEEEIAVRYTSVLNLIEEIPVTIHILAQPEEVILQNKWMDILPVPCFLTDGDGTIISATHDRARSFPEKLENLRHLKEVLDPEDLKKYSAFATGRKKDSIFHLPAVAPAASYTKREFGLWARYIDEGLCLVCIIPTDIEQQRAALPAELSEEQLHNLHGYISAIVGFTQILAEELKEKQVKSPYLADIVTASEQALKILDVESANTEKTVTETPDMNGVESLILLVDDDPVLIKMNTIFIERLGFKVISAARGEQALNLFLEHKNEIVMVISDIRIPDFSGYELAHKINKMHSGIPVILVSGQIEDEPSDTTNIYKVLLKPVMPNRLKQVIFEGLKKEDEQQRTQK